MDLRGSSRNLFLFVIIIGNPPVVAPAVCDKYLSARTSTGGFKGSARSLGCQDANLEPTGKANRRVMFREICEYQRPRNPDSSLCGRPSLTPDVGETQVLSCHIRFSWALLSPTHFKIYQNVQKRKVPRQSFSGSCGQ